MIGFQARSPRAEQAPAAAGIGTVIAAAARIGAGGEVRLVAPVLAGGFAPPVNAFSTIAQRLKRARQDHEQWLASTKTTSR